MVRVLVAGAKNRTDIKWILAEEFESDDKLRLVLETIASSPATSVSNESEFTRGGIDFNTDLINWQIKRDGNGVPRPGDMRTGESMEIDGFVPGSINVTPKNSAIRPIK